MSDGNVWLNPVLSLSAIVSMPAGSCIDLREVHNAKTPLESAASLQPAANVTEDSFSHSANA